MDSFEKQPARPVPASDGAVHLQASREKASGRGLFPRIPATSPSADRFDPIVLSSEATLYSFTVIHPNPKTGLQPFTLVYADFPENVRVFGKAMLRAGTSPRIGARLRVVIAPDGVDVNENYMFEVVEDSQ